MPSSSQATASPSIRHDTALSKSAARAIRAHRSQERQRDATTWPKTNGIFQAPRFLKRNALSPNPLFPQVMSGTSAEAAHRTGRSAQAPERPLCVIEGANTVVWAVLVRRKKSPRSAALLLLVG